MRAVADPVGSVGSGKAAVAPSSTSPTRLKSSERSYQGPSSLVC